MENIITRSKFICIKKSENFDLENKYYDFEFQPVLVKGDEGDNFFSYAPDGNLKFQTIPLDLFEVGQEYYLDFIKIDDKEK
jgi:hypothetical protein